MAANLARTEPTSRAALSRPVWHVIAGGAPKRSDRAPADDFQRLGDIGTRLTFERNETIFSQGDEAKYAYKVVSGAVRHCKLLVDGRRQIADFLMPGDLFGFVDFGTYAFSAEAITGVVVVRYLRTQVERLGDEDHALRRKLTMLLHERLSAAQTHLVMLGRQTVRERMAAFLMQMAERCDVDDGGRIDLPMGRQDIADYLGLTIETVCRAIGELKRAGTIGVPNTHQIGINDIEALSAVAEGEM